MIRPAFALALLGVALLAGDAFAQSRRPAPPQPRFGSFRDWIIGCDNRGDCTAMGFRDRVGSTSAVLAIGRSADSDAAPQVSLHTGSLSDVEFRDGLTLDIFADDTRLGQVRIGTEFVARDEERTSFDLTDDAVRQTLLDAMRQAGRLRFTLSGAPEPFEISLAGASAAILFMDDRQRRLGTVTALARRGERPASAVPAPPELPQVPQLRSDRAWRPTPDTVPQNIVQRIRPTGDDCTATEGNEPTEAAAIGRVAADLVLVQALCWRGAYNYAHRFHLWNDRTGRLTPLAFPVPQGLNEPQDILTNADFDSSTLTLSHFSKGRGLGDCGSSGMWRWDGRAFQLVSYAYMPECQGLGPDNWLTLHRSR